MRISKLQIPESMTKLKNLKEIDLSKKKLGSMVALVGKNGAGKSRVLKFVEDYIKNSTVDHYLFEHITHIPKSITIPYTSAIRSANETIDALKNPNISRSTKEVLTKQLNDQMLPFVNYVRRMGPSYVKLVDNDDLKVIKESITNDLSFESLLANTHHETFFSNNISNNSKQTNPLNEFTVFNNKNTLKYIGNLADEIISDRFELYLENDDNLEKIERELKEKKSYKLFYCFKGYIQKFLGKEFTYRKNKSTNKTISSSLFYNNQPFNIDNFSPGQKTLFAYAILFFFLEINSKANIRESIIIMDEPEKHLHPEAQINLINAIKDIVSDKGQLWIATHSINILSHLDYDEIIMVKDDEIIPPSRYTPGKSFNELMGLENHIQELTEFVNSLSDWAFANFMTQCFTNPDVVFDTNVNDPQYLLFKTFIKTTPSINLLDFGAGKGRIGYTISEDEGIKSKINYYAFEPNRDHDEFLSSISDIKGVYKNSTDIVDNFFDCVVLCNVLHEIHPKDWVSTIDRVKQALKDEGYLLIIEDKFLPKGEHANQCGYLILGLDEIKYLCNTKNAIQIKSQDSAYRDRIIFCAIKKEDIYTNTEGVIKSIKKLQSSSLAAIKDLRNNISDISQGRRYANYTQLYINSILALEFIG